MKPSLKQVIYDRAIPYGIRSFGTITLTAIDCTLDANPNSVFVPECIHTWEDGKYISRAEVILLIKAELEIRRAIWQEHQSVVRGYNVGD